MLEGSKRGDRIGEKSAVRESLKIALTGRIQSDHDPSSTVVQHNNRGLTHTHCCTTPTSPSSGRQCGSLRSWIIMIEPVGAPITHLLFSSARFAWSTAAPTLVLGQTFFK